MKTREQLAVMQREYEFYKDLSEKLEFRQSDELAALNGNVRSLTEGGKDSK